MEFKSDSWRTLSKDVLKIDKKLPQIVLSYKKLNMFYDWWNTDVRYETTVPKSFDEGYLIIDRDGYEEFNINKFSATIKSIAKGAKLTFREVENAMKEFFDKGLTLTIYFKFLEDNRLFLRTYCADGTIFSQTVASIGEGGESYPIGSYNTEFEPENFDEIMNNINYENLALLITCLWYIATTKHTTKYIYEHKTPVITGRHRDVVKVSDTKYITTPIYDMNKVRVVKVESLIARKKGWTYSHAFQVHGHYRHYKSGKVIFVESFIKGKDKEFKAQTVVLDPQ